MQVEQTYKSVGCDFIDQIEILATRRKDLELVYIDKNGIEQKVNTVLKTWETKEKEEFLITKDGLRLRLDRVLSLDGTVNDSTCSIL